MIEWFQLLGPLGYPLAACSIIAVALSVERLIFLLRQPSPGPTLGDRLSAEALSGDTDKLSVLRGRNRKLLPPIRLLVRHRDLPRERRDEVAGHWLEGHAAGARQNLRWLTLIGSLAPMLGLLGTVLGMTKAFKAIAAHTGPVSPQILSGGLWEAMLTTLAGLAIAVPVLVLTQIFRAWGQRKVAATAAVLNRVSYALDGIDLANTAPAAEAAERPERAGPVRDAA